MNQLGSLFEFMIHTVSYMPGILNADFVHQQYISFGSKSLFEALYMADALSWPSSVKTRHQLGTVRVSVLGISQPSEKL